MDKSQSFQPSGPNKESTAQRNHGLASMYEYLTRYIEGKSMRKTPERYEILRVASLANGIFTIDELMKLMDENASFQVSRATLFNTMELFTNAGLVIKHSLSTAAHYELRTDGNPKSYTICRQCNSITRVSTGTARLALQNLHVRYFGIEDRLLYMRGLCSKCQARNRQELRKNKISNKQDTTKNGKR